MMTPERTEAEAIAKKAKDYLDLCNRNEDAAIAAKKAAFKDWMAAEQRRLIEEIKDQISAQEGK